MQFPSPALVKPSPIRSITAHLVIQSHDAVACIARHVGAWSLHPRTTTCMRRKLWSRLHGVYLWPRWPLSVSPIQRSESSDEGGDASARLRASLFLPRCLYSPNSTSLSPTRRLSFDPRHGTRGKIPHFKACAFLSLRFLSSETPRTFV